MEHFNPGSLFPWLLPHFCSTLVQSKKPVQPLLPFEYSTGDLKWDLSVYLLNLLNEWKLGRYNFGVKDNLMLLVPTSSLKCFLNLASSIGKKKKKLLSSTDSVLNYTNTEKNLILWRSVKSQSQPSGLIFFFLIKLKKKKFLLYLLGLQICGI